MKAVCVPLSGARFIIFNDSWYDFCDCFAYHRFPKPIDDAIIYYKHVPYWSEDDEKIHETVSDILKGQYSIVIPAIDEYTLDMSMEEHELFLSLHGFTKYIPEEV